MHTKENAQELEKKLQARTKEFLDNDEGNALLGEAYETGIHLDHLIIEHDVQ